MPAFLRRCLPLAQDPELRPLFVLNLVLGSAYAFVAPFFSLYALKEVGMSPFDYGLFMMATALGGIAIGTGVAHFSDAGGCRRTYMLWGSLAGVVGYLVFAFTRSIPWLLVNSTLVLGLSSVTFVQLFAYAREKLDRLGRPSSETAFYLSAFRMFFALAWTVGPALAAWVLTQTGFRGLFFCAAALFALYALLTVLFVPVTHRSERKAKAAQPPTWQALRRPDLSAHFLAFVAVMCATTMGMSNLPLLLVEDLGGSQTEVGIAFGVAPVFELPFMLYCGWLATRREAAGMIRFGMVLGVVYFALLAVAQSPWQVYPIQILSAALTAIITGVAITYFQSHLPDHPGTATNLYSTAQRIGSTAGYFVFGSVAQAWGHRAVFAVCSGLAGLALLLMQVRARTEKVVPRAAA